jgi:cytoskeletal protein RodZ
MESVGSRLQRARLAHRLEIEEVAERTKIRPDRLIDLEADEYSNFPNLTYAKSFLAKYAKFLGVDITHELENIKVSRSISMGDYQYLSSITAAYQAQRTPWHQRIQARGFRVPPLVVAILVLIVLVGVPLFSYLALNLPRVTAPGVAGTLDNLNQTTGTASSGTNSPTPDLDALQSLATANPGAEAVGGSAATASQPGPAAEPSPTEQPGRIENGVEVRRALPVGALPAPTQADTPVETALSSLPDKKLEVRVIRKTYVKVTKDKEGTQPVFEGYTGPESQPIVVEGKRFWIHVVDKDAVELREDGQLVSGGSNDIVIN